jgi:hypothetical protein
MEAGMASPNKKNLTNQTLMEGLHPQTTPSKASV